MAVKPKVITQHCIKSHFFEEVMKLPDTVKIISISFEFGFAIKRMSQIVPTSMAKCGVNAVRTSDPSFEVEGKLVGSRKHMKECVAKICQRFNLNPKTFRVKRMQVTVGKGDKNHGVFHRMQKLIPGDDDKVSRRTVLGLVRWEGSESAIASACHTNPFKCKYDTQIIRTVLCEEA
jgi:hypothetical protein